MITRKQIYLDPNVEYEKVANLDMVDLRVGDRFVSYGFTYEVSRNPQARSARMRTVEVTPVARQRSALDWALDSRKRYMKVSDDEMRRDYGTTSLREVPEHARHVVRQGYYFTYVRDAIKNFFTETMNRPRTWSFQHHTKVGRVVRRPVGNYTPAQPLLHGITHLIEEAPRLATIRR